MVDPSKVSLSCLIVDDNALFLEGATGLLKHDEFGGACISQARKNKYSDKACAERKTFPNL